MGVAKWLTVLLQVLEIHGKIHEKHILIVVVKEKSKKKKKSLSDNKTESMTFISKP